MQEQHHYKTTPEQGWSGMLQVLDQAMPVATRQRRFIMFWWAAAAVSTAAIVALFILLHNNTAQLPSSAQTDVESTNSLKEIVTESAPLSVLDESAKSAVTENNSENQITQTRNSRKAIIGSENADVPANKNVKSETPFFHSSNPIVLIESEIQSPELNTVDETGTAANNHASSFTDDVTGAVTDVLVDQPTVSDKIRTNEMITSLPLPELASLEYETELVADIEPARIVKFNANKNLITPHLSAGIIDGFENGIGMRAAAGININVTPRLSLTTDVGYNIYSPDATLVGCACYEEDFADANGLLRNDLAYEGIDEYLPAETVFNSSGGSLNSFVSTIRQWHLSAGLKYDLSRRFFAEGGVALGFGTTAHSAFPIITFDNSAPISGDQLKISHSFDNVIKSNSTSAYAGIGYRLSPNAELYANATHSFDHYFLDNPSYGPVEASDRKDYIRGLNVGFRYNFQGP